MTRLNRLCCESITGELIRARSNIIIFLKTIGISETFNRGSKELQTLRLSFWPESALLTIVVVTRAGGQFFIITL